MPDERVLGLKIEDVVFVDAGRHEKKRLFKHLRRQGLVFEQLEKLVLEHHRALGGRHIFADLENAFVGHGHVALANIVHQVLQAFADALSPGCDGFLQRLGIECQTVARRAGGGPLLDTKTQPRLAFCVTLDRIDQPHQRACVEQVRSSGKFRKRVGAPGFCRKSPVAMNQRVRAGLQTLIPHRTEVFHAALLQCLKFAGIKVDFRQAATERGQRMLRGLRHFANRRGSAHGRKRLLQACVEGLLQLLGRVSPVWFRIHACLRKCPKARGCLTAFARPVS